MGKGKTKNQNRREKWYQTIRTVGALGVEREERESAWFWVVN